MRSCNTRFLMNATRIPRSSGVPISRCGIGAARVQLKAETRPTAETPAGDDPTPTRVPPDERPDAGEVGPPAKLVRRFYGIKTLDPQRVSRDADQIATEVVTHLVGLVGASVEVKLEISADVPEGVPEDVVRTVTENAKTLKFEQHGFEEQ